MAESSLFPPKNDRPSSPSSTRAPSPVPGRKSQNPIEPRTTQSLNSDITIGASNGVSKQRKKAEQTSATSPGSEPNRSTSARLRSRAPILYDMKYHPMDEVLRPNAHATLNAQSQRLISSSLGSSPRGLDSSKERETSPISNSDMKREIIWRGKPLGNSPRLVRSDTRSQKRLDSNMGYHPIDDVLRFKPRKRRSVWLKNVSISATSSSSTTLPRIDFDNPFTKPTSPDWRDLELFDHRVYILQKGAPLRGTTLPLEWTQVVEILVTEGFFTEKEFETAGGLTVLTSRYETIRLEIQGFFKSAPEPVDKRDWPIRYVEDLKVFDLQSGTTYWRHQRDSLVNPRSSRIANREQAVTANSEEFQARNTANFASIGQLTVPISVTSYASQEASYESALEGQLDDYNGNIDGLPDDQDHSFEDAFDLLQPSTDAYSNVDTTTLGDPFAWSNTTSSIPRQPEHHSNKGTRAGKGDRSVHPDPLPSDPKLPAKKRKRDSKAKPAAVSFEIHEDEPGGTPRIRKYVSRNPASPGTDIPKENFRHRRSPSEEGDLSDNYRMIRHESGQHLVVVPPSPHSNRFRAVHAVQPREPIFESPSNSEAMATESIEDIFYQR
ncbi:hypothetical protein MMC22_004542 [Lobaria immixta]|nr:hypothetical protein [Lobaria immixta]